MRGDTVLLPMAGTVIVHYSDPKTYAPAKVVFQRPVKRARRTDPQATSRVAIVAALTGNDGKFQTDIFIETGMPKNTLDSMINRMETRGEITTEIRKQLRGRQSYVGKFCKLVQK